MRTDDDVALEDDGQSDSVSGFIVYQHSRYTNSTLYDEGAMALRTDAGVSELNQISLISNLCSR